MIRIEDFIMLIFVCTMSVIYIIKFIASNDYLCLFMLLISLLYALWRF